MSQIKHTAEYRLPRILLDKATKSCNEYGWNQNDVCDVIEAARQIPMAVLGGQIQYVFEDGTCDLYWLSYDPFDRFDNEDWLTFCNRTAKECTENFLTLISTNIEEEAIESFEFIKDKKKNGFNLDKYKLYILYFDDSETDAHT